jgi:TolB-like protein/class 3 adenylate cyclase/tetratricopeptide (TPR) repeat protein
MPPERVERKLAAILAADIAGYSRLMGADEEGTLARLKAHRRELIDPKIAEHRGRVVKTTGDGILMEFPSVVDAVRCAIEIERGMFERNAQLPEDKRIEFRVGINLDDVMVEGRDLYGDGVNIAARLEALAEPGGICISETVLNHARDKVPFETEDAGEQSLKNIARPVHVYRIIVDPRQRRAAPRSDTGSLALPLPDKPSIAVLPFQNMSGDPEQEYFTDGMVEEIITALSRFKELFVIARNSSFTYKGKAVDVRQVGRALGVRYVLEGSVRKAANRVRITGQLIDASTGGHLWADHFDGSLEDVFELQDRVTSSVIGAIGPKIEQAEIERAKRKPTESLDAYDYFLRAMARCHLFARNSLLEARQLFHRATELDASYAAPYGMAVWCVCICKLNGWLADPEREITEGVRLARHAAAIGKDDPTALWPSGMGLAYLAGEVETGVAYADRAVVLNPNLAQAWGTSGWMRIYLGEPAEAIERFERAMRLSPLDPLASQTYSGIGLAHIYAGRYDEAASWASKAMLEQPDSAMPARLAAIAYALSDRMVEAREAMARLRVIDPALRLSNLERVAGPLRRAEDRARYIEGLRRAGLPE